MNTKLVHAGEHKEQPLGKPVATPIYTASTYTYPSMKELNAVMEGTGGDYVYVRYGNPTIAALEDAVATAENGKFAVAFGSGMAAIHASLMACSLVPGDSVIASQDLYGASLHLLNNIFKPLGIGAETEDFADLDKLRSAVHGKKPKVLLAETISNPMLKVCDISSVAEVAHSVGAKLIVDSTFASPYLCRPLEFGADISVHSATKYLGGHGDAIGGVAVTSDESIHASLVSIKKLVGGMMSVWEAHEILRGIKTLGLRVERQCQNAAALAERLRGNEKVSAVYYPGQHRVLRDPFGGALVSIRLKDDTQEAAFRFMDALQLVVRATSLGDVYTLVSHSASSSHRELSPKRRAELGITEGLVRISVGIEDVDDIIFDIEHALNG